MFIHHLLISGHRGKCMSCRSAHAYVTPLYCVLHAYARSTSCTCVVGRCVTVLVRFRIGCQILVRVWKSGWCERATKHCAANLFSFCRCNTPFVQSTMVATRRPTRTLANVVHWARVWLCIGVLPNPVNVSTTYAQAGLPGLAIGVSTAM